MRSTGIISLVAAVAAMSLGCSDDDTRIVHQPIDVGGFEYAHPVLATARESVLVRAIVGFDFCALASASIIVQGDSLVITGIARCEIRESPVAKASQSTGVATPPASPNPETFYLSFPPLDPGSYVLRGGPLCDSLMATADTRPAQSARIAALGTIFSRHACSAFAIDDFQLQYELANLDPPIGPTSTMLYGTFAGAATCDPDLLQRRIVVRRATALAMRKAEHD